MAVIDIYIDGGSKGNGLLNRGYGSFMVMRNGKPIKFRYKNKTRTVARFQYKDATNVAAEWSICLEALYYCLELINKEDNIDQITIHTDSLNVVNGTRKKGDNYLYHIKSKNVLQIAEKVRSILLFIDYIIDIKVVKENRCNIVRLLGH